MKKIEDLVYWIYSTSWEKEIQCENCRAFYPFFRTEFYKFNNTGTPILDSIYHMAYILLKKLFVRGFALLLRNVRMDVITLRA